MCVSVGEEVPKPRGVSEKKTFVGGRLQPLKIGTHLACTHNAPRARTRPRVRACTEPPEYHTQLVLVYR